MIVIALPWTLKLEMTHGCNLACPFCPVSVMPELQKRYTFMSPEMCDLATRQAAQMRDKWRIELTLFGEPTMNPKLPELLGIMRRNLPKAQIALFSNSVSLRRRPKLIRELLDAGANFLCMEGYDGTDAANRAAAEAAGETDIALFSEFSAYRYHPRGNTLRKVLLVEDINSTPGDRAVKSRVLHTNAGNANADYLQSLGVKTAMRPTYCKRPVVECVVMHDGRVLLCCHDWKQEYVLGTISTRTTLTDVWFGERHRKALRELGRKNRAFAAPCNKCDYNGGTRAHLSPDPDDKTPARGFTFETLTGETSETWRKRRSR